MRTVTLRADVYQGLLTQLQEQQDELREWRGARKPARDTTSMCEAIRLATGLAGQASAILACLINAPGRVFAFGDLVDAAAPYVRNRSRQDINAESIAKTRMAQVRRSLEGIGHPDAIKTLRGSGYVMQPASAAALKLLFSGAGG